MSSFTSARPAVKPGTPPVHPGRLGFEFHALPKELLRAGNLSFGAVCLFSVILNLSGQGRRLCTLSNAALADELGRCPSEVRRYLAELEGAGLVRRQFEAGAPAKVREGIEVTWKPAGVAGVPAVRVADVPAGGPPDFRRGVAEGPATNPADVPAVLKKGLEGREEGKEGTGFASLGEGGEETGGGVFLRIHVPEPEPEASPVGPIAMNFNPPSPKTPAAIPRGPDLQRCIEAARGTGWPARLMRGELARLVAAGKVKAADVPPEFLAGP